MQRKHLILAIAAAGIAVGFAAVILIAAVTYTPMLEYDPRLTGAPEGTSVAALKVAEFLRRSGRLPPPGTGLVQRNGMLEWEIIPESALRITDVTVSRVRLTSGAPLLMSVLDDDPTYRADVDVIVTTSDGRETILRVTLWDYGLLTPWSFRPNGDGLKPGRIYWN